MNSDITRTKNLVSWVIIGLSVLCAIFITYALVQHETSKSQVRSQIDELKKALENSNKENEKNSGNNEYIQPLDIKNYLIQRNSQLKKCLKEEVVLEVYKELKKKNESKAKLPELWGKLPKPTLKLAKRASPNQQISTPYFLQWDEVDVTDVDCVNEYFEINKENITIKTSGRYFVSSQVIFKCEGTVTHGSSHLHRHTVEYLGNNVGEFMPLMINSYQMCGENDAAERQQISKQGGIYQLEKDSKLKVKVLHPKESSLHHNDELYRDTTTLDLVYIAYQENI